MFTVVCFILTRVLDLGFIELAVLMVHFFDVKVSLLLNDLNMARFDELRQRLLVPGDSVRCGFRHYRSCPRTPALPGFALCFWLQITERHLHACYAVNLSGYESQPIAMFGTPLFM